MTLSRLTNTSCFLFRLNILQDFRAKRRLLSVYLFFKKRFFVAYDSMSILSPLMHTYRFHINALRISPLVSKVLVQFLFSGLGYFVKLNKVLDNSQISVKSRST